MLPLEHIWAHKPSPRYRLVLFVRLFLCALVLGVLLATTVLLVPHSWRMLTMWIAVGIGTLLAVIVVGYPFLSYHMWSYELQDEQLVFVHGWLYRYHCVVPMARVQYVDTVAGPIEQCVHVRTLKVRTAARAWSIPSLEPAVAEQLFNEIAVRARVADDGGL